jgi:hypothetical protein
MNRPLLLALAVGLAATPASAGITTVSQDRFVKAVAGGQVDQSTAPAFDRFMENVNVLVLPPVCACGAQAFAVQDSTIDSDTISAVGNVGAFVQADTVPLFATGESHFEVVFDLDRASTYGLSGALTPLQCEFVAPICSPGIAAAILERLSPGPEIIFESAGGVLESSGALPAGRYRLTAGVVSALGGVVFEESQASYFLQFSTSPSPSIPALSSWGLGFLLLGLGGVGCRLLASRGGRVSKSRTGS